MPTTVTICPQCNAEIPRSDLSLCPYCATPLPSVAKKKNDSPTAERLRKIEEKTEDWEAAMAWTPVEGPHYQRALRRRQIGSLMVVIGAVVLGLWLLMKGDGASWFGFFPILAYLITLPGLLLALQGAIECTKIKRTPMLRRAAIINARRSETELGRGNTVTYFFEVEFPEDTSGEFAYPGRGAEDDLMVPGVTGCAYTRGTELIAFRRIRV